VLVASKQKRGSSNDLGWLFVCNKHITLIIIVDEYLRLNDNIWLVIMLVQIKTFGFTALVKTRLLRLALFWHFLDLIWIGIFTIVYLAGLSG
ncbi:MAG: hypothetical protein ABNH21_15125, partial [Glaciecola sp.]